jgi:alpha-N-acetylglucosaminidase
LANYASRMQQDMAVAWQAKDTAAFHRYSRKFLALMDDMDRMLATREDFLLGKWIHDARGLRDHARAKKICMKRMRGI